MRKQAIQGAVPRIQPVWSHIEMVRVAAPPFVLLRLDGAETLCSKGETAHSYFPDETTVITSATRLTPGMSALEDSAGHSTRMDEIEIVQDFDPAYHIPSESPLDQEPDRRLTDGGTSSSGRLHGELLWMDSGLESTSTSLIPLVESRHALTDDTLHLTIEKIDPPIIATTVSPEKRVQARSSLAGEQAGTPWPEPTSMAGHSDDGQCHADSAAEQAPERGHTPEEESDRPFLAIGCLNPTKLSQRSLPPSTIGAAGLNHWRQTIQPERHSESEIRSRFKRLQTEVSDTLSEKPPNSRHH